VLIDVDTIPGDSRRIVASLYETYRDARQHERAQEIREEIHETAAHHSGSEAAPMPERYARVDPSTCQERERTGGGAASRDLGGALGAENLTARVWRCGPGHEMAYHRHRAQQECSQLVSGGPQEVLIEAEPVVVNDGGWLRLPKDTTRKIQNHTDREAIWLTIGAPPGDGIRDGVRIDIATGQEIPRSDPARSRAAAPVRSPAADAARPRPAGDPTAR